MTDRYDAEFNRSFPRQKEGPEFTGYVNYAGKRKKIKFAAAAAAVTTAVVAASVIAGLFTAGIALESVGTNAAAVVCTVDDEYADQGVGYILYTGDTVVAQGALAAGSNEVIFSALKPDTPYRFVIIAGGIEADSMSFKTLPLHGGGEDPPEPQPAPTPQPSPVPPSTDPEPEPDPEPAPVVEPDPEPEPEPEEEEEEDELTAMTFDSLTVTEGPSTGLIYVTPSYTLNDSVITGFVLTLNGDTVDYEQDGSRYVIDVSGYTGETVTIKGTYTYTTDGTAGSASRETSYSVPDDSEYPELLDQYIYAFNNDGVPACFRPEIRLADNGNTITGGTMTVTGLGTYTMAVSDALSGDDITVLVFSPASSDDYDYIRAEDLVPDDYDPDSGEVYTLEMALTVSYTDTDGSAASHDYTVYGLYPDEFFIGAEYNDGTTQVAYYLSGSMDQASISKAELYISDDESSYSTSEEPWKTVEGPSFTDDGSGGYVYTLDLGSDASTYSGKWLHTVFTATVHGYEVRIPVNSTMIEP